MAGQEAARVLVQPPGVERAAEHHAVVAVQVPDVRGRHHVDGDALSVRASPRSPPRPPRGAVSGGVGDEDAGHAPRLAPAAARAHPRPSDDPARDEGSPAMDAIVTVGDLARALGVRMEELVPHGMYSMGSIDGPRATAEYAWDMYHEAPVDTLGALAGRRLISYRVDELGLEWRASEPRPEGDVRALLDRIAHAGTPGPIALDQPVPALALAQRARRAAPDRAHRRRPHEQLADDASHGRWRRDGIARRPARRRRAPRAAGGSRGLRRRRRDGRLARARAWMNARLRRLLDVGRSLISELEPEAVLERLLEVARELTGARYAAIGVLDERREGLERFLTVGHRRGDAPRDRRPAARARRARRADQRSAAAAAGRRRRAPAVLRLPARAPADDHVPRRADR